MAKVCHGDQLPVRQLTWYTKAEATFSDVLAAVRRDLWYSPNYSNSSDDDDMLQFPKALAISLVETACYST